jgi:hypothetical protein
MTNLIKLVCHTGTMVLLSVTMIPGSAEAGPPFRTDDPEPVGYRHYEFYTLSTGTHISGDTSGMAPAFDFNYGITPDAHTHIIVPAGTFDAPEGPDAMKTQYGYGDTELGLKYRFIEEDKNGWRPQVGTFPIMLVNSGAQSHGLGSGHISAFFPLWVQKSFGPWTTYGGGGYWLNHGGDNNDKDYWFFGWVVQRKITEKLTLGGEIFHQTATKIDGQDSTSFNIGGFYDIDDHNHILFSGGRAIQNAQDNNLYSWYIAYQITR